MTRRAPANGASRAERLRWGMRLTAQSLRRHRLAFLATTAAFAFAARQTVTAAAATTGTAQLVAFLDDALPATDRDALAAMLGQLPGVAGVRVLPSDEALVRMRAELGPRAPLLDGVEEGFLPTTLEIALRPGHQGVGRADELAWRLRRMAGISDVDVLRSEADQRLLTEQETARRLRLCVLATGGALVLAALGFVAVLARRRRGDAELLAGLGFTDTAVCGPAFLAGAAAAAAGVSVVLIVVRVLTHLTGPVPLLANASASLAQGLSGTRGQVLLLVAAMLLGGAMGWRGMRLPAQTRRGDGLAPRPLSSRGLITLGALGVGLGALVASAALASTPAPGDDPAGRGLQLLQQREVALRSQTAQASQTARQHGRMLYRLLLHEAVERRGGVREPARERGATAPGGRAIALGAAVLARDLDEVAVLRDELARVHDERRLAEGVPPEGVSPEGKPRGATPQMTAPVSGPATTSYGVARDDATGAWLFRTAEGYAPAPGSPVVAPADGRVARVTDDVGGGVAVVLAHAGGWTTVLAGLGGVTVGMDELVKRGGLVGTAGPSSGPALRVEVWHGRVPVDPAALFAAAPGRGVKRGSAHAR